MAGSKDNRAMTATPRMRWISHPEEVDPALLDALAACWTRVSDSGGAVGFPFLPVEASEVRAAAVTLRSTLGHHDRLLTAHVNDELAGWLVLKLNRLPLTAHWGAVSRVQTDLHFRRQGLGRALMTEAARASQHLGLQQLHIAVRGGQGLEDFYAALGWQIIGRWPAALRLGPGDDRDEVLMVLQL